MMPAQKAELSFSIRTPNGHSVVKDWRLVETLLTILERGEVTRLEDISITLESATIPQAPVTPAPIVWRR